jgi:hypothetical protein
MVCTTPLKVDKANISSSEAPVVQALVARPESKVPDDTLVDDDPDLLNFTIVESGIACSMSSLLQMC